MHKLHAIYGFKINKKSRLRYTSTDGWPSILGKRILLLIQNHGNEELKTICNNFESTIKCPIIQAEYRYIINLDNLTLEYYCHNNIPRAIFSFSDIRRNKIDEILAAMNSLDEPAQNMYDLFSIPA